MPELPEVETIRRGLERLILKKRIESVHNYDSLKSFPNAPIDIEHFLIGSDIVNLRRRGKMMLIELSSRYTLMVHLKMTGQLVYIADTSLHSKPSLRFGGGHPNDSLVGKLPDNTTREHLHFSDGSRLYFNDLRKFGYMKLVPTLAVEDTAFMKKIGPEPLDDSFMDSIFIPRIRRRNNTSIKAAILDQSVLAGVGNIYADESLWASKIHPAIRVHDVTDAQLSELLKQIKYVLNISIEKGGSTDKNYVDAEGKKGSYLKFANVFRLEGHPCPRCGTIIEKIRVAGRGTHICPTCQQV